MYDVDYMYIIVQVHSTMIVHRTSSRSVFLMVYKVEILEIYPQSE